MVCATKDVAEQQIEARQIQSRATRLSRSRLLRKFAGCREQGDYPQLNRDTIRVGSFGPDRSEAVAETAAVDCTRARARLERVRIGWHRFESKDKPAFIRWRAREFGALLSRAREVEIQISDNQQLVHEVEMEMRRGFQDTHTAYQRVMFRRTHPHAALDEEVGARGEKDGALRKLSDFEKEALFQEWVQKSLGTNPDKMDDEAYATSFEAFKSHMFRSPLEETRPRSINQLNPRNRIAVELEEEGAVEAKVDARVKELYRILVRRLHPDLRADESTAVSAFGTRCRKPTPPAMSPAWKSCSP